MADYNATEARKGGAGRIHILEYIPVAVETPLVIVRLKRQHAVAPVNPRTHERLKRTRRSSTH